MNILLIGYGAMGKRLRTLIETTHHHTISGIITTQQVTPYPQTFENCKVADVIIDFSHCDSISKTLAYAIKNNIPTLIATTGHSVENLELIKNTSTHIPILLSTNTSYGVAALIKILKTATPLLDSWDIEMIEKHHNKKLDAPSGTAKTLLETIESSSQFAHEKIFGRSGLKKREPREIATHAVRGGTIVGEHSVIFCGQDEVIEITHSALSKDVFAYGAIKMAEILVKQEKNLYTMQDLLKI